MRTSSSSSCGPAMAGRTGASGAIGICASTGAVTAVAPDVAPGPERHGLFPYDTPIAMPMHEPEFRIRPENGVLAEGPLLDTRSVEYLAERLAAVPGVVAVTLGGSRAVGAAVPSSDWDFGLYYRGGLDPADISALGWPGRVFAPGEWGSIVNGGAWLTVGGARVDLIYRDLDEVLRWTAAAEEGRFQIRREVGYVAGIATYILAGELALGQVLAGELPRAVTRIGWPASCVRSARNTREAIMGPAKIAVAGATGRLGRHVVEVLGAAGHEVVPISRSAGVDVITGDGLADAVTGADAIIDVTAGPSSEQR